MMWRAILIDDEEYVRAELKTLFPWRRYGFALAGEAENVRAAMALIESARPDLVITDIRMPEMDGLALISWIGRHHPQSAVAVVSAYDDFPYVREALRLGAVDYLIKAEATFETAADFLKRVGDILARRQSARRERERLAGDIVRYQQLATDSFWRDLLTGAVDETELANCADQLGIVTTGTWFGLLFIHIAADRAQRGYNSSAIRAALAEEIRAHWDWDWAWHLLDLGRSDFAVIASRSCTAAAPDAEARLRDIACRLADPKRRRTVSASTLCTFSDLPARFREARETNLLRLYGREGSCIDPDELLKLRQAAPPKIPGLLAAWERSLRDGKKDDIHAFLHGVFSEIMPRCLSPGDARRLTLDFVHTLRRVSLEHQIRWEEVLAQGHDPPEILEQAESVQDWQAWLESLAGRYLRSAKADLFPRASTTIRKALVYIQANFTRDLTLAEVADRAGVSKSYLSRIFPAYVGERFSQYLQRLRLERAKELLRFTDERIYEIAARVGFWNSRYFSRVFHDAVGMTPADYRRAAPAQ